MAGIFKAVVILLLGVIFKTSGNVVPLQPADGEISDTIAAETSDISLVLPSFTPTLEAPQGFHNLTSSAPFSVSAPFPTESIFVTYAAVATTTAQSNVAPSTTTPTLSPAPVSALKSLNSLPPSAPPSVPSVQEAAAAETIQVVQSTVIPPVREMDKPIMDIIQKGLTRLRHAGDRLKKFIEKIEDGIKNGAVSQTIENVKAKIESGKVDLTQLISAYKQQSPMNFEDLIRRISDDTHILLDKLHGRVDPFGAYNKTIPHDASDESAEDHHTAHPTAQSQSSNAKLSPAKPNSVV